jgi:hypothetical protein
MTNQVGVLFIAGDHAVAGAMEHNSSRVLDMLNSAGTEFLRIKEASVFRGLSGEPIDRFPEVTLPKSAVDCVILTEDRHEAPLLRNYSLVEKRSHPVLVVVAGYELRGEVMFGRAADPLSLLNSGASTFFPIVSASVSSPAGNAPAVSAKVAIVNKAKVLLLQIGDPTLADSLRS